MGFVRRLVVCFVLTLYVGAGELCTVSINTLSLGKLLEGGRWDVTGRTSEALQGLVVSVMGDHFTGKSWLINKLIDNNGGNHAHFQRLGVHVVSTGQDWTKMPTYTFAEFSGFGKPVPLNDTVGGVSAVRPEMKSCWKQFLLGSRRFQEQ